MGKNAKISYMFLLATLLLAIVNYVGVGSLSIASVGANKWLGWAVFGFLNASILLLVLLPLAGFGTALKAAEGKYKKRLMIAHGVCICSISAYSCYIGLVHWSNYLA